MADGLMPILIPTPNPSPFARVYAAQTREGLRLLCVHATSSPSRLVAEGAGGWGA